ncbi:hypothetical protein JIN84_05005 [Luteolibacter yonseiensis]|uniref:Uncharacterized protein n=1 Tax=Luteolibacter yonseiensis TaxID=1144680 RepID=A0A934R1D3_9BACT|nr:hypothetical protein [Luteolibacter yonseiensis]MBK1814962.1 hypothetical protein [Luteolibacter yonseiensis]
MTDDARPESCLLVLPDGRLLARNVTPELSELLRAIQPGNPDLALRAALSGPPPFQIPTESDP